MAVVQPVSTTSLLGKSSWEISHKCSSCGLSDGISFVPLPKSTVETMSCSALREQLFAAYSNICFLQKEHATVIQGLHDEIERLHRIYKEHQFKILMKDIIANEELCKEQNEYLEQEIKELKEENYTLRNMIDESNGMNATLNHNLSLLKWRYGKELAERDKMIENLQSELEVKCSLLAEMNEQLTNKRFGFFRRFSFNESNDSVIRKSSIKILQRQHTEASYDSFNDFHLNETASCLNSSLPLEVSRSNQSSPSPTSSYCSLNKKRNRRSPLLKLPPIHSGSSTSCHRSLIRNQLRVKEPCKLTSDTLSIDDAPSP